MKSIHIHIIVLSFFVSALFGAQSAFCSSVEAHASPQEPTSSPLKSVVFDKSVWSFGEIKEDGGSVEHIFSFENRGDKPVVIVDVTSGCGCTTPTYSRKPILKGQRGEVKVAFDPIGRPGKFSKGVSVITSLSKEPIILTVEGVVLPREKSLEELYPFDMGGGVRLSSNFHAFSYIGRGESVEGRIGWINTSKRDARFELVPESESSMLEIELPKSLPAGERGEFVVRYSIPAQSQIYGTLEDSYRVRVNGENSRKAFSTHAIAVDRFDRANDDISSPIVTLSKNFIKFGEVKYGNRPSSSEVILLNEGSSDLIIRAVEFNDKVLQCSLKVGDRVPVDKRLPIQFTLDTSQCDYGVWSDRVRIITNDPTRPMINIRVTAIVVD